MNALDFTTIANGDSFIMAQFLKDEVKEKIKEAALVVFTEYGFAATSIKAIAEEAKVSVGNVYRYYENKEALYSAVIENVYNGVRDIMEDVNVKKQYNRLLGDNIWEKDPIDPLVRFVTLYRNEARVFKMLLKNGMDSHYMNNIQRFIDLLRDYFYDCWGEGNSIITMSHVESSALANALIFGTIDLLNHVDDAALDQELTGFIDNMMKGYIYAKGKTEEGQ